MKKKDMSCIADPITHSRLIRRGRKLCSGGREYKVISGVPIMLEGNRKAVWHREIVEAILWEYPEEVREMYKELPFVRDYSEVYIKYIERLLKDKEGITAALNRYADGGGREWTVSGDTPVTRRQKRDFRKFARKSTGEKRTETKVNAVGAFTVYPHFAGAVHENSPQTIVELGTGAGGATAAVALGMGNESVLYTVDIDFPCLGNAVGIRKYQRKNIVPICGDFRHLPFADGSIDVVCTYNGFDESRENGQTVKEVGRILKKGGRFVAVSRESAFMRQGRILGHFGFSEEEALELMKKCRLYSDADDFASLCRGQGIRINKRSRFDMGGGLVYVLTEGEKLQ